MLIVTKDEEGGRESNSVKKKKEEDDYYFVNIRILFCRLECTTLIGCFFSSFPFYISFDVLRTRTLKRTNDWSIV